MFRGGQGPGPPEISQDCQYQSNSVFIFFFISLELVPPPSTTDLKQPIVVLLFQHTQNFIKSFHTQKPYSNLLSLTG